VRYHLVDEGQVPKRLLDALGGNLAAALIRLERCERPTELGAEVKQLDPWLSSQPEIRRSLSCGFGLH
jgi:hypothetical protein